MKFEIINPSDKAFIEGENFETVCLAIAILSRGQYGLQEVDGGKHMPILMFSDGWWLKEFGRTIDNSIEHISKKEIAKTLRTVRLAYERSSLTDIVGIANNLAKHLESL